MSTPFDPKSVDILERIGVERYKMSSGDITNKPLLEYVAAKNKPIIISTGMSTLQEHSVPVHFPASLPPDFLP